MHMMAIPAAASANSAANNEQRAAAALQAAAAGLRIVILNNADGKPSLRKAPVGNDWGKKATDDEETLLRRLEKRPNANFGVLLGKYPEGSAIPGVIDVEFDCDEGRQTAERIFGSNTFTPTYRSARSVHRLFLWNDNFPPIQVLKLDGLEVRLGGGAKQTQSVMPPSIHEDGTEYRWLPGLSLGEVELAEVPEILAVQFANVEHELEAAGLSGAASSGSRKPDEHWDAIKNGVAEGSRNESLCSLVGKWAANTLRLDADSAADIRERAIAWGERCSPPLPAKECEAVARNVIARDRKRRAGECDATPEPAAAVGFSRPQIGDSGQSPEDSRPEVLLTTYLGNVTDEVVARIGKIGWESPWIPPGDSERLKIYQRGGQLVQVISESDASTLPGRVAAPAGAPRIRPLPVGQVPLSISNACDLITETRTRAGIKRTSTQPPRWLTEGVFSRGDYGSDIRRLSDIEPSKVDDFVSKLKAGAEGKRAKLDASTTTKAHYRTAIKSFTSWLASPESGRRISFDPLARTGGGKRTKERRLRRRAIMVAEWQAIQKHVKAESFGIEATERLLAYELALQTGLRASEIHSLKRSRLKLTGKSPSVVVPSDTTKDSIDAHQHITPELAAKLRAHVSRKAAGSLVFALPHAANLADMIRADMNAAREAWLDTSNDDEATKQAKEKMLAEHPDFLQTTDSNGERVDFHALRHTCGAWLALAGVHPKTIQSVMRHKDIKLTLDTYGHLFRSMEADAVQKMAAMIAGSEPESLIDSAG